MRTGGLGKRKRAAVNGSSRASASSSDDPESAAVVESRAVSARRNVGIQMLNDRLATSASHIHVTCSGSITKVCEFLPHLTIRKGHS